MKLKIKYLLFVGILHLICLVLSYFILAKHILVFLGIEVLIIFSVLISISLYRQLIMPLRYLKEGINAIKDRDFSVKFISTGNRETDELIQVYNQMIDELRAERLRQEEQHFFLEKLIQTSPTGIIVLDYDNQVQQINPTAESIMRHAPEDFTDQLAAIPAGSSGMIRGGGQQTFKVQKSHFIDRGFKRVFILLEEVTKEIFDAEKNVYSKVIRMMAHEVNNTIGPVNSIISSALDAGTLWPEADSPLRKALEIAVERNLKLNVFMRNLADLVKGSAMQRKRTDILKLLNDVTDLMHFKAREKNISITCTLPGEPVYIIADAMQIEQVLINIIKNAIEAIGNDGRIDISLDSHKTLTISDTGKGISPEAEKQLFTPFFSTKKDGQGIGLLLVREILSNHGFSFELKTVRPGETNFTIKLA